MKILQEVPLPQQLGLEGEPPYRRRQKAVAVRRSRFSSAWALIKFILTILCLGAPSAFGLYQLAIYAQRTPLLMMKPDQVQIEGDHNVSRAEILSALGIDRPFLEKSGVQLLRLDLSVLQSRVAAIPWVESVTIIRSLPHQLTVRLVERQPVGFVNVGGQIKLIDRGGVILEPPQRARYDFPVLWGLDSLSSLADRRARLSLYLEFNRKTAGEAAKSGWIISEVDLTDGQNLKALLVQGSYTVLAYFGQRKFAGRFHRFVALMPQVISSGTKAGTMDLRYPDQVVVDPAGSPPQNGQAKKGKTGAAADTTAH